MIEIINVSKKFSNHLAVKEISLKVGKGEILGLLGPNGAGKTTTMRMITGSLSTTSGDIIIGGHNVAEEPMKAKKLIGYLPENPPLYTDMTVDGFLRYVGKIKGIKENIDPIIESTQISDVRKRVIKNLSKGYKQRVGIASALIGNPPILILDEPTIGLDPKQIKDIRKLIKQLVENHTIILSTHILSEVTATCSKVAIINRGNVVAIDDITNLTSQINEFNQINIKTKKEVTLEDFKKIVGKLDGVKNIKKDSSFIVDVDKKIELRDKISETIVSQGWGLIELNQITNTLEDIFLELTSKEL